MSHEPSETQSLISGLGTTELAFMKWTLYRKWKGLFFMAFKCSWLISSIFFMTSLSTLDLLPLTLKFMKFTAWFGFHPELLSLS